MRGSPLWRRLLTLLLIAAAGWYLGRAIAGNWEALRAFEWEMQPLPLLGSVVLHVAVLAWGVWVWSRVLRCFDYPPVPWTTLLRIWFLSNLARYIPGKVFQFLAVAHLGRGSGISGAVLLTSLVMHTGLALLSAVLLATWTLGAQLVPGAPAGPVAAAAAAASLFLVNPVLLNRALTTVSRLLRRDVIRWTGRWRDGAVLLLLSVLSWCFYGVAYFLFVTAVTGLPLATLPLLSGVNALSFVAGYLAIVTPGGLGVREAAMTGLLLPLLPDGVAAVLAIGARLWTIAAEVIGGVLTLLFVHAPTSTSPDGIGDAVV